MPQSDTPHAALIASLFIEAVREGQSLWFLVTSNSMLPLMLLGDRVFIQPAQAREIRIGEIAAFETSDGLVIHRIVHVRQAGETIDLLQMADVNLHPTWVKEQAIVGKVVYIQRKNKQLNLLHPIAKRCGTVTARIRYQLYLYNKNVPLGIVLRICSRLVVSLGYWIVRVCCASIAKGK
ncbi:MAG TPA: S24 family peptidase [Ktedonobacteraceae bacterium]|nr:S24 family peptidase [Ktedonobacteraceae bacterium]